MRPLLPAVCALLLTSTAYAQDETDALRYSFLQPIGTARAASLGGAVGSVGGDFTALSINPAGIAIYRRDEVSFTPSLVIGSADGTYTSGGLHDDITRFGLTNLGYVHVQGATGRRYDKAAWKSFSFGLGVTRLADFNRRYQYAGNNTTSSASERFAIDANDQAAATGTLPEGSLGDLGYQTYLVDTLGGGYASYVDYTQGVVQSRRVTERGSTNEVAIAIGANYREKLLLGATLGLPIVDYRREAVLSERDAAGAIADFESFDFTESLATSGVGVNLKLGAIYRPSEVFRAGIALHTPTVYTLRDEYQLSLVANTEAYAGVRQAVAPLNVFDYRLTTPYRAVVSATGFFGDYGFLSADYEYVGYNSARYRFATGANTLPDPALASTLTALEQDANDRIRATMKGASNVRLGAEVRFQKTYAVRVGAGYYGSPVKADSVAGTRLTFSAGGGYRGDHFFVDLGIVYARQETGEQPYTLPYPPPTGEVPVPRAVVEGSSTVAALTVGYKF